MSVQAALKYAKTPNAQRPDWVVGLAYYKAKNYRMAATYLERAARSNSRKPGPLFWLGYSYLAQGKTNAAEATFVKLTKLNFRAADKARIYLEIGVERRDRDKAGALVAYRKAATLAPKWFNANFGVGILLIQTGDWKGADEKLSQFAPLCASKEEKAAVFSARGELWEKRMDGDSDKQKALSFYKQALQLDPTDAVAVAGAERLSRNELGRR